MLQAESGIVSAEFVMRREDHCVPKPEKENSQAPKRMENLDAEVQKP